MYFIELFVKKFFKNDTINDAYDPMQIPEEEEELCEHIFMPIDSTGEVLACKNCGFVVKRKDLKNINFFKS